MDATAKTHVGIDVSKKRLDAHALPSGRAGVVDNTADGASPG